MGKFLGGLWVSDFYGREVEGRVREGRGEMNADSSV